MDGREPLSSLSLIIPAYNEASVIRQAVIEAETTLREIVSDCEVIVVNDGSSDQTSELVQALIRDYPHVRLIDHPRNLGYGAALSTGFRVARYGLVAFTDADCQFHLRDLALLVPSAREHGIAVGIRQNRQDSALRCFYSRGYNLLARTLIGTGVQDCDCALKVFRKDVLERILPRTNGFFVNAEMLTRARQQGFRVKQVPVSHRPRAGGDSKVSIWDIPRTLATLIPFWWSSVAFRADHTHRTRAGFDFGLLVVLLLASVLFLSRLTGPLLEPDEARYAEIPRQMLADGNWLVPTLHDQPYVHKPPLLYWLVMASYSLFGVHDWAARIVPGIAGVLMVAIAYLWGRRTLGFRPGLFGAIMLATSVRFLYLGRMLNMDGILGLCVLCGWSAGYLATRDTRLRWRWWSLSAVATAFGVLTKGPVALVLVLIPFILLTLLDDRRARLGVRGLSGFAAIVAGIATPWFLLVAAASPGFNREFLWTHNLQRFFAPLDHEEPVWYFLPGLLLGMMPWTLLLPTLLKGTFRPTGIRASRRPAALGFVLLCVLWTLTFFSLSGCKRPAYILPAMPPLALALGYALHAMLPVDLLARVRTMSAAWTGQLAYRTTQAVTFAGIVAGIVACVSGLISDQAAAALTIAGAAFLAIIHWTSPRRHVGAAWAICAATTATLLMVGLHLLMPGYERRFALRAEVSAQQAAVANPSIPVVCYPRRWDSVSFYLRRGDVQVFGPRQWPEMVAELRRQPSTLVFIKSDNAHSQPLKEFLGQLPASLEFTPLARHGIVTAGVVQRRAEAPSTVLARR